MTWGKRGRLPSFSSNQRRMKRNVTQLATPMRSGSPSKLGASTVSWTGSLNGAYPARMVSRNDSHTTLDSTWSQLPASRQKLRDRKATRRYVEEIDRSSCGQLCVLYLNGALDLIGVMRWCGESAPALGKETRSIVRHGKALGAAGYILARTDLGETYRPDRLTVSAVSKLRRVSAELDLPLMDYLVFPAGQTVSVGGPQVRGN